MRIALALLVVLGPDPHRAMRLAALAVVRFRLGKHGRVRALVEEALALDPHEASALALLPRLRDA